MSVYKFYLFILASKDLAVVVGAREELERKWAEQRKLVASLEEDLLRVNSLTRPEVEGSDNPTSPSEVAELLRGGDGEAPKTASGGSDSMLAIVSSQRERLRARVGQLEEANRAQADQMAGLESEVDKVRGDNVKLYQKIKFLQGYTQDRSSLVSMEGEVESRYSGQYEASLDPFRRFASSERSRTYASLPTHDKATLGIGRVIMNSARARAAFFFYLLVLHLLIFVVLYRLAFTESCKRDTEKEYAQKYAEHMQMVHGTHG